MTPAAGCWSGRSVATPQTFRFASTGPYYVEVGDQPRISRKSAQFFLDWVDERGARLQLEDAEQRKQVVAYLEKARDVLATESGPGERRLNASGGRSCAARPRRDPFTSTAVTSILSAWPKTSLWRSLYPFASQFLPLAGVRTALRGRRHRSAAVDGARESDLVVLLADT